MFGVAPVSAPPAPPRDPRKPLRRALWLACALVALWLAMQFVPTATPAAPPSPAATAPAGADAGTVVHRSTAFRAERQGFPFGYVAAAALLIGGGVFALKMRQRAAGEGRPGPALTSMGTLTLAPGQTLHLVACGADVLLVGQSGTGVNVLATYGRADFEARPAPLQLAARVVAPEAPPTPAVPPAPSQPSFADMLRARAPHLFVTGEGRAA